MMVRTSQMRYTLPTCLLLHQYRSNAKLKQYRIEVSTRIYFGIVEHVT
jgi:hypothetical protein